MATWYKTGEEIKAMYPDIIFEEYWITREDAAKLKRHGPVIKGWATIEMNGNTLSCIAGKNKNDERDILLHIKALSSLDDDVAIRIHQEGGERI